MRRASALTHVRQLCCLNAGGKAVVPALLKALHDWLPSHANAVLWFDASLRVTGAVADSHVPLRQMDLYLSEYCNAREAEIITPFNRRVLEARQHVKSSERFDEARLLNSAFYHEVFKPCGIGRFLEVAFIDGCREPAYMTLSRSIEDMPFRREDAMRLQELVPYLVHAFNQKAIVDGELVDSDEPAIFLLDQTGKIQYISRRAEYWLRLAGDDRLLNGGRLKTSAIKPMLKELVRRSGKVRAGADSACPAIVIKNAWGQFTFRAYWLASEDVECADMIAVEMQYEIPASIRMAQNMKEASLSSRQQEICLLLSRNLSHAEIANKMGVSRHTVIDYVRLVYGKLDVSSRSEMIQKLQSRWGHANVTGRSVLFH